MTDQIHLVVARPCFGGQVSSIYASSIVGLRSALQPMSNIDLKVHLRDGDECMIDPATGTYLSEDFAFCKRSTDIGGEIWADLDSRLDHVGLSVFHGDVASQFAAAASAADAA